VIVIGSVMATVGICGSADSSRNGLEAGLQLGLHSRGVEAYVADNSHQQQASHDIEYRGGGDGYQSEFIIT